MGAVKDIIDLTEKLIERRQPIRVESRFEGSVSTVFLVTVSNVSRAEPVTVKEVRVHFGMHDYSYAFVLSPREILNLAPKHDHTFHLSQEGCVVKQRVVTDCRPNTIGSGTPPETPGHLFVAIAKAKPNDSWIEVDFNEFADREFMKGHVQPIFAHMLAVEMRANTPIDVSVQDAAEK